MPGGNYERVAASQTDQILGTGAVGDWLDGVLVCPQSLSPGAVLVQDGDGTAMEIFPGGANSVLTLHPFFVPFPGRAWRSTTPGWSITTGANVVAYGFGSFGGGV